MKWFKSPLFRSVAWAIVVIVVSTVISVAFWEQLNEGESLSSTISPNPPKGSGHPEEARDERSRLETAWP